MTEFLQQLIIYLFYALAGIQIFFLAIFFGRMVFFGITKQSTEASKEGVSVVISAKNEYLRLKKFLPSILNQDYPVYEVIVVNDSSSDETEFLLKELKNEYPHLNYLTVQSGINFFSGKKFPLSMGIKSAKYDLLLLTDADCQAASPNWITEMQALYNEKTDIVLGFGAYEQKKGILNNIIRYDTLRVAILYFSFAVWKIPYMGVGRNLSYRKSLFYDQKGFMSHYDIPSGDDDLFINKAANRKNTRIAMTADAKTISIPKQKFTHWLAQKRRHQTTGKKYKLWHLFLLSMWELSTLFFYIILAVMIVYKIELIIALSLLFIRLALHLLITKKFMLIHNERKLLLSSPLVELFIVVINPFINLSNLLLKQRKWK